MPRSWIEKSKDKKFRWSAQYRVEVNKFIEYAFSSASKGDRILCPCINCVNQIWRTRKEVLEHLVCDGFLWNYTKWTFHGEGSSSKIVQCESNEVHDGDQSYDGTHAMLNDIREKEINEEAKDGVTGEHVEGNKFDRLMEDAKLELYPGCVRFTRLSFILRLYHIKCLHKITNKAFSMLLDLLGEALPEPNTLPKNMYETKKIIKDLGLNYNKIMREEMRLKDPNHLPLSRIEMFEAAYMSKKTGLCADNVSATTMDTLKQKLAEESEERQLDKDVQNEIFQSVMGPDTHGRVRLLGSGVTPKDVYGKQGMRAQRNAQEIRDLRKENAELREKHSELNERLSHQDDLLGEQVERISEQDHRLTQQEQLLAEYHAEVKWMKQFISQFQPSQQHK